MRKYQDKGWLQEQYKSGKTGKEIAEDCGASRSTIYQWLDRHGIDRDRGEGYRPKAPEPYRDREWLREEYKEKRKSTRRIAKELGCSHETIRRWVNRHGIEFTHQEKVKESWVGAERRRREAGERFAEYHRTLHPFFFTRKNGYEHVGSSDGEGGSEFVPLHRLLAVAEYGFDALMGKVVHHRNNIPWDNRPDNIELMTPSEHSKHHNG